MFSQDAVVLIVIANVLPILIASFRNHTNKIAVASVTVAFTLAILFSPRLGVPAIPPILAFPVWIGILIWAAAGPKSKGEAPTPAANEPNNTNNRHLPENLDELDKLAVKIRKAVKESDKNS